MKKSFWIEMIEWVVLAVVAIFVLGVVAMRHEITSSSSENPSVSLQPMDE
jgi:hypothetical protein